MILANTASGTFTLETSSTASDSFTIDSGDLSGGASTSTITVAGAGTITLGGANTYAGLWNLSSGTLSIGADTDLGAAPTSPGVANYLTFSGGTLDATASFALSQYRGIQLGTAGGTFDVSQYQNTHLWRNDRQRLRANRGPHPGHRRRYAFPDHRQHLFRQHYRVGRNTGGSKLRLSRNRRSGFERRNPRSSNRRSPHRLQHDHSADLDTYVRPRRQRRGRQLHPRHPLHRRTTP